MVLQSRLTTVISRKTCRDKKYRNKCFKISAFRDRGPVHINFPFRKPFEKNSFTDDFDNKFYPEFQSKEVVLKRSSINSNNKLNQSVSFEEILKSINTSQRGILIAGPESFNEQNKFNLIKLSTTLGYPIFADALSGCVLEILTQKFNYKL